jgi:hypothetical protein
VAGHSPAPGQPIVVAIPLRQSGRYNPAGWEQINAFYVEEQFGPFTQWAWPGIRSTSMTPNCMWGEQLQRVRGQLVRREVKTETSEAPLPLPDLCVTELKIRKGQQDADRGRAGDGWIDTGLIFTTRHGTPIEPRNFDRCVVAAQVPRITVHGMRKTCASLLAERRPSPSRDARPAAQQDRRHDGDLYRGSVRCHW